jgi:AraC-like DNA-binding protein
LQLCTHASNQDYALDRIAPLEGVVPLSDACHYRWSGTQRFGGSWAEFCGLADGFCITFGEVELDAPSSVYFSSPDTLQVYVASNGNGEFVFAHGDPLCFEAPNSALILEPPGEPPRETTFTGCNRYVFVFIHRETLETLFAGSEHELPDVIRAFLDGEVQRTVARPLPLGGALLRCLEDVLACPLEGRRRRLLLQSRAIEIICQAIEALEHTDGLGTAGATASTVRGVLRAQRLLADNFVSPPSLEDLALKVGLSRSGMCTGFRRILGQSVFDYIQSLRMRRALDLLNGGDASITQIAHAVGYNHTSSFSVAVQRRFGATPTELRRRSAPK